MLKSGQALLIETPSQLVDRTGAGQHFYGGLDCPSRNGTDLTMVGGRS